ncbi:MAG TPA: hypothetical protein VE547_09035 [Mycobacteriales bacterium]|nr:hypothetical protein [Mycobacteriales bacterium]
MRSPEVLWFNGAVVPWAEARVHAWSETAARGANVFEGIRAYWHPPTGAYYALFLPEHLRRLYRSAKLLRFPPPPPAAELVAGPVPAPSGSPTARCPAPGTGRSSSGWRAPASRSR